MISRGLLKCVPAKELFTLIGYRELEIFIAVRPKVQRSPIDLPTMTSAVT